MKLERLEGISIFSVVFLGFGAILTLFVPLSRLQVKAAGVYTTFSIVYLLATLGLLAFFLAFYRGAIGKKLLRLSRAVIGVIVFISLSAVFSLYRLAEGHITTSGRVGMARDPLPRMVISWLFLVALLVFFTYFRKEYPLKQSPLLRQTALLMWAAQIVVTVLMGFVILSILDSEIPMVVFRILLSRWVIVPVQIMYWCLFVFFMVEFFKSRRSIPDNRNGR